ncbi:MAG: type II toxin-antitoxin system RelE/ParE family toxin [Blastochloris sp.]|nr:type II toxin-antitoxin system RelE/ParE family toxin [Blastochloris sp.]
MKWVVFILVQVEKDLEAARDWYDKIDTELGDSFLDELAKAIALLENDPERKGLYYRKFRRILLKRFPYKLFYQIIQHRVIVFRVLHAKQCHEKLK